MNKTVQKILKAFSTILVVLVLILAFLLVGVRLFGLQVYTVLSGSMEPEYHTGSLIYVRPVDYKELKVKDVITFALSKETTATHRIIEIVPDEIDPNVIRYRTKGDANKYEDNQLVHCQNVIGKPVFTIPLLGYFASYVQKPPGMYIAISVSISLIILVFAIDMLTEDEDKKKKKKRKKAGQSADDETDTAKELPAESTDDLSQDPPLSAEDEKFTLTDLDLSELKFDQPEETPDDNIIP